MDKPYQPQSQFLLMLLDEEIPLTGSPLAEHNLAQLIELTSDPDESNRDWATMCLVQSGIDTPETRAALRSAADDPHIDTRCEALLGLAVVDPVFAFPRVQAMLEQPMVFSMTMEAAGLLGDRRLVPLLQAWFEQLSDEDDQAFRDALVEALDACRSGAPIEPWWIDDGPSSPER